MSSTVKNAFRWRAIWILGFLQLGGNLASIPMLKATGQPVEAIPLWILYTLLSFILIGGGLYLAGQTGMGAPFFERRIKGEEFSVWIQRILALSLLFSAAGSLPFILLNRNVSSDRIPAIWKMALASMDAGIQEELFYRLFLMSLFVWLGRILLKKQASHFPRIPFWIGIILSGLVFGWSHIDHQISEFGITESTGALIEVMLVNTVYGVMFGYFYWKHGLECAMFAHFMLDAVGCCIVIPATLSRNPWIYLIVIGGLILTGVGSYRFLSRLESRILK